MILARELSLSDIKEIRSKTNVELEYFVHGALCVSYSGQCYLGHAAFGRSGNRGVCAQPCRLKYTLKDGKGNDVISGKHLLSLKDLNLISHITELAEAGITCFKIEGRYKDAAYVKNVTAAYRQALDRFMETHPDFRKQSSGKGSDPHPAFQHRRYAFCGHSDFPGDPSARLSAVESSEQPEAIHLFF